MMAIKMKKKFANSNVNNGIQKTNSECSVLVNNQEVKKPQEDKKVSETLKILDSLVALKNFEELINLQADTLLKKQNKSSFQNLFEKLTIKEKVRLMVRVYKDMANNLNFAFDRKNLEDSLEMKEDSFWSTFRSKKIKSQQVKNMEYNNIIKAEKVELLERQIEAKRKDLMSKKEERFSEFMKLSEMKKEIEKEVQVKTKNMKILRKRQNENKLKILEDFFSKEK